MQYRMKTHQLPQSDVYSLLQKSLTGTFSTVNQDGTPYSVPIHFVFLDGAIYFHGLPAGQKIINLKANPHVCFTVYEMRGLLLDSNRKPCDTNTEYVSAIIQGTAKILSAQEKKRKVLSAIVAKYTPQLSKVEIPQNMINGTAVVQIDIEKMTGKYYR